MTAQPPFAPEREVTDIKECWFYHAMELPGYGEVPGQWDLRGHVDEYIGKVKLAGKRVLEVGTASGFLCFEMEKRGAEVIGYDLSGDDMWDIVPIGGSVREQQLRDAHVMIQSMNNGWWLAHRALNSKARVVYGTVYNIPVEIGPVHISTFGCILLHLRDPFLALQRAAALTTEAMVVTDLIWPPDLQSVQDMPKIAFYPDPDRNVPDQEMTWWHFSPDYIARYLKILGFRNTVISFHQQKYFSGDTPHPMQLYTVVGSR